MNTRWIEAKQIGLAPGCIDVWYSQTTQVDELDQAFSLLSEKEQMRAERFCLFEQQQNFILAHAFLRKTLSHYMSQAPRELSFTHNQYGKPYLEDDSKKGLQFNLSHAGETAVCAVTLGHEVGIDVEEVKPRRHIYALAERYFTDHEYQALKKVSDDERLAAFYHIWTRKEAFIKAVGQGLSYPLDQFEVSLEPGTGCQLISIEGSEVRAADWELESFYPNPKTVAALATKQVVKKINWYQ